jgi:hypothetical protein
MLILGYIFFYAFSILRTGSYIASLNSLSGAESSAESTRPYDQHGVSL